MALTLDYKDTVWVRSRFNRLVCVHPILDPDTGTCYCGREMEEHRDEVREVRDKRSESIRIWVLWLAEFLILEVAPRGHNP